MVGNIEQLTFDLSKGLEHQVSISFCSFKFSVHVLHLFLQLDYFVKFVVRILSEHVVFRGFGVSVDFVCYKTVEDQNC
jgi:hypothetical protein